MDHLPRRWLYSSVMVDLNFRADNSMSPEYTYDKEDIIMVNSETTMASTRTYRVFKQKHSDW